MQWWGGRILASVLWLALPRRHAIRWALAAAAAIAVLDLRVIAPIFFPEVAALAFWPQLADHLMWGVCVGIVLEYRWKSAVRNRPA